MFADILKNRLFIGVLVFFIPCVGGSLFYSHHKKQKGEALLAETQDRVKQWNKKRNLQPTTTEAPIDTPQTPYAYAPPKHLSKLQRVAQSNRLCYR